MPLDLVRKVLCESAAYPIESIDVGESGDAFLNDAAVDILRHIRSASDASIRIFTNFQNFTPDRIDLVLSENLLDKVVTNIDGATPETYRAVKGLDLARAERHILHFLRRRRELESPVDFRIQCLTLHRYVTEVRRRLGRDPLYVPAHWLEVDDDFEAIVAQWVPRGVTPTRSFVVLWGEARAAGVKAERSWREARLGLRQRLLPRPCRLLERLERSLFVAASGKVYLCCADFNFELILGDLHRETVPQIVEGAQRRERLDAVRRRAYRRVGGPCLNSHLCRDR